MCVPPIRKPDADRRRVAICSNRQDDHGNSSILAKSRNDFRNIWVADNISLQGNSGVFRIDAGDLFEITDVMHPLDRPEEVACARSTSPG